MSAENPEGKIIQSSEMRFYRVFYKGLGAEKWVPLERGVHKGLYETESVQKGIQVLREHEFLSGVTLTDDGNQMYNLIAFNADFVEKANDPFCFILHPAEDVD